MSAFSLPDDARWLGRPPLLLATGLQGHVLVVLAWRRDDVHGRAAMVELATVAAGLDGAAFAALSVHVGDGEGDEALRGFLAALPASIPTAIVRDAAWLRARDAARLPFLFVVDALGELRFAAAGVPRRTRLIDAVRELLAAPAARGRAPDAPFVPHALAPPAGLGASALLVERDRVWMTSPARRQVVELGHDGAVRRVFGSGEWGLEDGAAARARFALPDALAAHEGVVVVSDQGAHALRAIDRDSGEVTTICGSGRLGADGVGGGYGRDQSLHSPRGVVSREGGLYVANQGTDQLWQVDPLTGAAMSWLDGFSQPAGVAMHEDLLWVADAGCGEVAEVDLAHVQRRAALGGLARPVAVAAHGGRLFVADRAAREVRALVPATGACAVLLDAGRGLVAPTAVAAHGDELHVLDAGRWLVVTLDGGGRAVEVRERAIVGMGPSPSALAQRVARVTEPVVVAAHSDVLVRVPTAAAGRSAVDVLDEAGATLAVDRHVVVEPVDGHIEVLLPVADAGAGAWRVRVDVEGVATHYVVPVTVRADGEASSVTLRLPG